MHELDWMIYQGADVPEPWEIRLTAWEDEGQIMADAHIRADWLTGELFIRDTGMEDASYWIDTIDSALTPYGHPLNDRDRELLEQTLEDVKERFLVED